jgi:hypothetical protein
VPALRAVKSEPFIVDHGVSATPADDFLLVSALMHEHKRIIPIEDKEVFDRADILCRVQGN